jgi:hypothetical protein
MDQLITEAIPLTLVVPITQLSASKASIFSFSKAYKQLEIQVHVAQSSMRFIDPHRRGFLALIGILRHVFEAYI